MPGSCTFYTTLTIPIAVGHWQSNYACARVQVRLWNHATGQKTWDTLTALLPRSVSTAAGKHWYVPIVSILVTNLGVAGSLRKTGDLMAKVHERISSVGYELKNGA